jgi:hypothetical protein
VKRINTREDRSADSQWHSGFRDTMSEPRRPHPRVPRPERKASGASWLVALPFAVAIAVIVLVARGVLRG